MDPKDINGLVVLEYLRLGLVPYFPGKKTDPIENFLDGSSGRVSKRKFRKLWNKTREKYFSTHDKLYGNIRYGYPG